MKTLILILILIATTFTFAQPPETLWTRTYGWDEYYYANAIGQAADGGFIIGGYSRIIGEPNDWRIVRTDEHGDTLWTHSYGSEFSDRSFDLEVTPDGGCVMTGSWGWRSLPGPDSSDYCLMKIDSSGAVQWTQTYRSSEENIPYDVEITQDGGYILAGHTHDGGQVTYYDWFVVKTDAAGDTLWTRRFDRGSYDVAYSVQQTDDGGYIIAGHGNSIAPPWRNDIYIMKLTESGVIQWERFYGGDGSDYANAIERTLDGGYVVTGRSNSFTSGGQDIYLLKLDSVGDSLWMHFYEGFDSESGRSVKPTADGGYIIVGYTQSFGLGWDDFYVIRTDSIGDTLWTNTYGGYYNDGAESVIITDDGGYIVAGHSSSFGEGMFYVVRLCPDEMSIAPSAETSIIPRTITLHPPYPNPFNASTTISYDVTSVGRVHISIYNLLGQQIASIADEEVSPGSYSAVWDAGDRPSGIYLCRMEMDNFHQVRKIVLLK